MGRKHLSRLRKRSYAASCSDRPTSKPLMPMPMLGRRLRRANTLSIHHRRCCVCLRQSILSGPVRIYHYPSSRYKSVTLLQCSITIMSRERFAQEACESPGVNEWGRIVLCLQGTRHWTSDGAVWHLLGVVSLLLCLP